MFLSSPSDEKVKTFKLGVSMKAKPLFFSNFLMKTLFFVWSRHVIHLCLLVGGSSSWYERVQSRGRNGGNLRFQLDWDLCRERVWPFWPGTVRWCSAASSFCGGEEEIWWCGREVSACWGTSVTSHSVSAESAKSGIRSFYGPFSLKFKGNQEQYLWKIWLGFVVFVPPLKKKNREKYRVCLKSDGKTFFFLLDWKMCFSARSEVKNGWDVSDLTEVLHHWHLSGWHSSEEHQHFSADSVQRSPFQTKPPLAKAVRWMHLQLFCPSDKLNWPKHQILPQLKLCFHYMHVQNYQNFRNVEKNTISE